jgi:hypothetical protein
MKSIHAVEGEAILSQPGGMPRRILAALPPRVMQFALKFTF